MGGGTLGATRLVQCYPFEEEENLLSSGVHPPASQVGCTEGARSFGLLEVGGAVHVPVDVKEANADIQSGDAEAEEPSL